MLMPLMLTVLQVVRGHSVNFISGYDAVDSHLRVREADQAQVLGDQIATWPSLATTMMKNMGRLRRVNKDSVM